MRNKVYSVIYPIIWIFMRIIHPWKAVGADKIPEGAAVICGNHTTLGVLVMVSLSAGCSRGSSSCPRKASGPRSIGRSPDVETRTKTALQASLTSVFVLVSTPRERHVEYCAFLAFVVLCDQGYRYEGVNRHVIPEARDSGD